MPRDFGCSSHPTVIYHTRNQSSYCKRTSDLLAREFAIPRLAAHCQRMTGKPEAISADRIRAITVALGPDDRAIPSPRRAPGIIEIRRTSGDREFRRELLVNLDAQTRLLLRQHVAVLDSGQPTNTSCVSFGKPLPSWTPKL